MDRISLLPDDVVLKILSMVPSKDAVTSSLLSKRWCSLWKLVPKLYLRAPSFNNEHWRASRFVDKFLLLHKAPVLEILDLRDCQNCHPTDIRTWISVAISRGVRGLQVSRQYKEFSSPIQLPRSLYTCETLVALTLRQASIVDVPMKTCLRSLKTLFLEAVSFSSDENVRRLLSGCPVLERLCVSRKGNDNVKTFTIIVPSLLRLTVDDDRGCQVSGDDVGGFVIKAPCLKSLTIVNRCKSSVSLVKMPNLFKASIGLSYCDSTKMECLTSAKHLYLCLYPPVDSYPTCVFYQLVSLTLHACSLDWCSLVLRNTPILRVLRLKGLSTREDLWEQPSCVPKCLVSSLETVEWTEYEGTEAQQKVVIYLLENTRQLKTMAIRSLTSTKLEEKHRMLQELASAQRSCCKCQLSFT